MQFAITKIRSGAIVSFARPRIRFTAGAFATATNAAASNAARSGTSDLTCVCMTAPGTGQCMCGTTRNWFERVTA